MNDVSVSSQKTVDAQEQVREQPQYSLRQILRIWALAALPMALLAWVVTPLVGPINGQIGYTRAVMLTVGLIWQFVVVLYFVYREEGSLSWATLRRRLWLNTPRDPKTGAPRRRLWWWLVPLVVLYGLENSPISPGDLVNKVWVSAFPFLSEPRIYSLDSLLSTPAGKAQLAGAWWFLGLFFVLAVFNTILGEELLFRGLLLPRMRGSFGKRDWVANGALFGLYHLHQPWMIPSGILSGMLLFALPARYFRSAWLSIIVHSAQSVFILFLLLGVVLGLA